MRFDTRSNCRAYQRMWPSCTFVYPRCIFYPCLSMQQVIPELENAIRTANTSDDADIVVNAPANMAVTTCPITRARMQDPVCSKRCGHVYSRAGIMAVLARKAQCPIPGCRQELFPSDLVEHLPTRLALARMQGMCTSRVDRHGLSIEHVNSMGMACRCG